MSVTSFVDLSYRGLSLGRRIKLTQLRPSTGYLEHPTPMPVGTRVAIVTDDGLAFDVVVTRIHEQIGGTDRPPGMTVAPALATPEQSRWWKDRVTLPEEREEPVAPRRAPERSRPVTVRPRSHTTPQPPPSPPETPPETPPATPAVEGVASEHDKQTRVMDAVDQELLEELTRDPEVAEDLVRTTGEHEIVDDGKRTTLMDAVDVSALGLEIAGEGDDGDDDDEAPAPGAEAAATNGKAKKKKRKKRR